MRVLGLCSSSFGASSCQGAVGCSDLCVSRISTLTHVSGKTCALVAVVELLRGRQEPGERQQSSKVVEVNSSRSEAADFLVGTLRSLARKYSRYQQLGFGILNQNLSHWSNRVRFRSSFFSRTLCGR